MTNDLTEDNVTVVPFGEYQDNDNVTIYSNHPEQFKAQILNLQVIVNEIQKTIEMYESLNRRHQESYEESNDDSYLNTIARNTEIISELQGILQTKAKRN